MLISARTPDGMIRTISDTGLDEGANVEDVFGKGAVRVVLDELTGEAMKLSEDPKGEEE